jgi:hypothetical protein
MQMMNAYWDAAAELDLAEPTAHEAVRFGFCRPEPLRAMFAAAGLTGVDVTGIVVPTVFGDFDESWSPFLGGTGAAPAHLAALPPDQQARLRDAVRERLHVADDGSLRLTARAWGLQGTAP